MKRFALARLAGPVLALALASPAAAGGARFEASPDPEKFLCKNVQLDHMDHQADDQGNKLSFSVWLTAICAPWTSSGYNLENGWTHVTAEGFYDYAKGTTREDIVTTADQWTAVQVRTRCDTNPWAHSPACDSAKIDNNTGLQLVGPFPISAHMVSYDLRQSFASWETSKTSEQILGDWNPLGPEQKEELAIVKPTSSVSASAASFPLELNALHPEPGWVVELEWARIEKAKDPSIEIAGHWVYGQPAAAPKSVGWGELPKEIGIPNAFQNGQYAVRAKVQGHPENTWTDWKRFWVGAPTFAQDLKAAVKVAGGKTQTYSLDQPGEGFVFGPGGTQHFDLRSAKPQGGLAALSPQATPAPKPAPAPEASKRRGEVGSKVTSAALGRPLVRGASLVFDPGSPVGVKGNPGVGALLGIAGLRVKNTGQGASPAGSHRVELGCEPLDGGSCQVQLGNVALPAIQPAESHHVTAEAAFRPQQPGRYRLTATIEPSPKGAKGTSWSREVNVPGVRTDVLKQATPAVKPSSPQPQPQTLPSVGAPKVEKVMPGRPVAK